MAANSNIVTANVRHVRPPIVIPKPSMWADIFSTFTFNNEVQEMYTKEMEALKNEARSMLMAATSTKLIVLIDKLERLALAYHFEIDIEEKLKQVYDSLEEEEEDYNLFATALRFRLLRQHQYHVSSNVFNKFVDKDGKWKSESLNNDVEGILSLYEAAHVRIREEKVLDEAVKFTVQHLTDALPTLESSMKRKVQQALTHSIHRSLPLLNVRFYISVYESDSSTDEFLIKLAKLNFNFLQNLYRKELSELTRWWDKFDLKSKLPYARDRVVECYLWGTAFRYEPQYSYLRVVVAKTMQLVSIMDDTYDNYATLEEIDLFTDILERCNLDAIDALPDYMKIVYRFIMSVFEDYEAISEFVELIENGWKDATAEWAKGSSVPKVMVEQVLNYGRIAEVTYKNKEDGYTNPEKYLGPLIASLYVDPLLI